MAKKRVGKLPKAFHQMAVDRLNQCENIVALAKELGVSWRLLYTWREPSGFPVRSNGTARSSPFRFLLRVWWRVGPRTLSEQGPNSSLHMDPQTELLPRVSRL